MIVEFALEIDLRCTTDEDIIVWHKQPCQHYLFMHIYNVTES